MQCHAVALSRQERKYVARCACAPQESVCGRGPSNTPAAQAATIALLESRMPAEPPEAKRFLDQGRELFAKGSTEQAEGAFTLGLLVYGRPPQPTLLWHDRRRKNIV